MQIIPRSQKDHPEVKSTQVTNIGFRTGGQSKIPQARLITYRRIDDIIEELEDEGYTVIKESVNNGCCQYATYIYYLEGEMRTRCVAEHTDTEPETKTGKRRKV